VSARYKSWNKQLLFPCQADAGGCNLADNFLPSRHINFRETPILRSDPEFGKEDASDQGTNPKS
jgi:hypothetical protein